MSTPLVVWAINGLADSLPRLTGEQASGSGPGLGNDVLLDALGLLVGTAAPWLGILLFAFLIRSVETAASQYLAQRAREQVDEALRRQVYDKTISIPLAFFERDEYYTKLENGRQVLGGPLVDALRYSAVLVSRVTAIAGLLLLYAQAHWLLALILIITTIVRSAVTARQMKRFLDISYGRSPLRREIAYWANLLSSREQAPELRAFGLGDYLIGRWRAVFDRYIRDLVAARRDHAVAGILNGAFQEVIGLVTVISLLFLALQEAITIGTLIALLYGFNRYREVVDALSNALQVSVRNWSRVAYLRDFLSLDAEPQPVQALAPPCPIRTGVQFHDVSFTYPGATRPAIDGVNLLLRPGERIALVGENGAGKTTLVRVLLGLYRPTSGTITVDGADLSTLDPEQWRREVTAIFQDFMRYPATVAENIGVADVTLLEDSALPDEGGTSKGIHPRILEASRRSGADSVAGSLPSGYATLLSKDFEGGVELSTGQWQKLALARAYTRDAQIVVLDEPTAALDPRAEVEVYRQFAAAAAGRCAIFISHRLGSARLAGRIVVLSQGRVVEEGDHESLLQKMGEYGHMYSLQASWYAEPDDGSRRADDRQTPPDGIVGQPPQISV
ncbi:MAG TPA: ABC transporter ATP-binding protein, partial [Chloroflexota bacterium]|nr:ABC transporter ATP-binding protein [Chloroflexota bacterium]